MLITDDDDGVNSESFFFATWTDLQPETFEETWPEGWQQRHLLASGGGEGSKSPTISFKSQVHIWFRKQSHTMEPSQRFHGNGTFGECCSSVGKAKVDGDGNNNGRSHQPDFPQTGAELLDLLDTQRSWCFNREDEQVSLKVGADKRQEQWLVATAEQSGKAVVWVLVFSDLLCVYHRVWMRLYNMKVLETRLVACTAYNMICRYQQTDTLSTRYDTQ